MACFKISHYEKMVRFLISKISRHKTEKQFSVNQYVTLFSLYPKQNLLKFYAIKTGTSSATPKGSQEPAIYAIMRGLSPQVYYPLNREITPEIGGDHFAATSAIEYITGCDGRDGVLFNGNDYLKLAQTQKYTGNFSFSMIMKFNSFAGSFNGPMGGVIFGNGNYGLGYALGFYSNENNKLCMEGK